MVQSRTFALAISCWIHYLDTVIRSLLEFSANNVYFVCMHIDMYFIASTYVYVC